MANRYTKLSTSTFDPMSFQEQLFLPKYMREQHDSQNVAMSELDSGIAKSDPLAVHSDIASKEQQRLYEQITTQRDKLANEGFTQNAKNELLRLNKEYQSSISPTGVLGKANASKAAYTKNFQEYMKDATEKKKWSREQALTNWSKFEQNYTGFDSEGGISNIGQLGAPTKVNLMDKLKDLKGILGDQVTKEVASGNYSFARQKDGSLAVVNRSGRRIETSNAPNLKDGMQLFNAELSDPNSEWAKSIDFEGINPENLSNQINSGLRAMLENDVKDNITQNISFKGVENLNKAKKNNVIDFEGYSAGIEKIYNDQTISTLDKILSGDPQVNVNDYSSHGDASFLTAIVDIMSGQANTRPLKLEEQSGELKNKVNNVFNGLKKLGVISNNANINDKNTLTQVINHIKDNNNVVIEPNLVKVSIQDGVNKAKDIINQASSREFYNVETGDVLSYDLMVKNKHFKGNKDDDYRNIIYKGQLTADNMYSLKVDPATADNYVTPHVVKIGDKEFLVTESRMNLNTERSALDKKFNKIFQKIATAGNLPIDGTLNMNGRDINVSMKTLNDKNDKEFNIRNGNKEIITVTERQLKENGYMYLVTLNGELQPVTGSMFRNMSKDLKLK